VGGLLLTDSNCVYKTGVKYSTYCGLNSFYNNYDVYQNNLRIVVK